MLFSKLAAFILSAAVVISLVDAFCQPDVLVDDFATRKPSSSATPLQLRNLLGGAYGKSENVYFDQLGNVMYVKVIGPGSNHWFFSLDPNVDNPSRDIRSFERLEFDISIPDTATDRDFFIYLTKEGPYRRPSSVDSIYASAAEYASGGLTTADWQTVSIPLSKFAMNLQLRAYDFEHVGVVAFADLPRFTNSDDAIYIANIRLIGKKETCATLKPSPTASPTPSPTSGCRPTTLTIDDFSADRAGKANLVGGHSGASSNVAFWVSSGRMNIRATKAGSNYWFTTLASDVEFARDLTPFTHLEFDAFIPDSTSYKITLVQANEACTDRDSCTTDAKYQDISSPDFILGMKKNGSKHIRIPLTAFEKNVEGGAFEFTRVRGITFVELPSAEVAIENMRFTRIC
ncbi:hypothetical protein HK102_009743 [Quaeritorhiza haematococci]|nr:hypothetical protein HK102_009743 [Quaeritorhiza haematococci]